MDALMLDPANLNEVTEPVKLKRLAHVQVFPGWISVTRWHNTRLVSHRYLATARNFARYLAMRDRIEETLAIPF